LQNQEFSKKTTHRNAIKIKAKTDSMKVNVAV